MRHGKYKHYKGKFYEVFGEARHSETLEEMVIYRALFRCPEYGENQVWVRPKNMFCGTLTHNGKIVKRFTWVDGQSN